MITKVNKKAVRAKRHMAARKKLAGTASVPRLSVFRSLNGIYVQFIDDDKGVTLAACSSMEKSVKSLTKGKTKKEAAKIIGMEAGKKALAKGIEKVVFDRGGYIYTGRVQQVAEGARESGLKF